MAALAALNRTAVGQQMGRFDVEPGFAIGAGYYHRIDVRQRVTFYIPSGIERQAAQAERLGCSVLASVGREEGMRQWLGSRM